MTERKQPKIPFVGLHAHSTAGSPFDAIGYPNEHMDFCWENGMDAIALTDHGNCNGLSYQVLYAKKMKNDGKLFKPIYGVEAYFIPSIKEWSELKAQKALEKKEKIEDDVGGAVVEDEESSKKKKNPLNKRSHLILLAKNQKGLNNIFWLVSNSFKPENFYKFPRIDYKILSEHSEGIIASSACLGGIYASNYWENKDAGSEAILNAMRETTINMQRIFGKENWFGELQWIASPDQHALNQYIIQISKEFDLPLISTADSHYPHPELWKDRTLYKKLNPRFIKNESKDLPSSVDEIGYELYPKNGDEMFESYKKYAQLNKVSYDENIILNSITKTHDIAFKMIDTFTPDNTIRLPDFVIPPGESADDALTRMAYFGLNQLFHGKNLSYLHDDEDQKYKEYENRLKQELKVICGRGFSKYFLTMKAISDKALELQLTGPGRGSAAGSLVAYLLNITQVDPIKWGLMFERFLRSDAKDYPDIDYDCANNDAVKQAIIDMWGEDNVASISNWNTLQFSSLLKDVCKFYDIPFKESNEITNKSLKEAIPKIKESLGIKAGVLSRPPTFDEVLEHSQTLQDFAKKYPEIKEHISNLFRQVKSCSRHAGGLVVGENLPQYMPLIYSGGVRQTPWSEGQNVRHLEPMGFIKFDILGIGTLRMIQNAIELILKKKNNQKPSIEDIKVFYNQYLHPDVIDFDDQAVYEDVFHNGKWAGIFQFSENGMQSFAKKSEPRSLIDLSALTSIWRPGPMCLGKNTMISTKYYYDSKYGKYKFGKRKTIQSLCAQFESFKQNKQLNIISYDENKKCLFVNKIKNVYSSGTKPVYKVLFQNSLRKRGKSSESELCFESSLEHRFLTTEGWKTLETLEEGDYILSLNKRMKFMKDGRNKKENVFGKRNFHNISFRNYKYRCFFCDWNKGSLDVNHIDGNRTKNNEPTNLSFLCPNHHREYSEGKITQQNIIEKQKQYSLLCNDEVIFVRYCGKKYLRDEETYDIEVEGPYHNFIAGDFIVHNSTNVHHDYVRVKQDPDSIEYTHPLVKECLHETYGFLIFQEQIAALAHRLGKDVSLEEGNLLRKVMTKKGTGKGSEVSDKIHDKFIAGCLEKGIAETAAENLWDKAYAFKQYGFNKSHAVCYSVISFQCAWMLHYYPAEWLCAFLNEQPEERKNDAISVAKKMGYEIAGVNVNTSGVSWEPSEDGKTLIQPLNSIKGLGDKAMEQIIDHRPFNTIEEFLFNNDIKYSKLNKRAIDVLVRSGACDFLKDSRFVNNKHFWMATAFDRPKIEKLLISNIEKYKNEDDFSEEEKIENIVGLTGIFPLNLIVDEKVISRLESRNVPPISEFDADLGICWFIPRKIDVKKTKWKKDYWVLTVIDSAGQSERIKCWGITPNEVLHLNRPYAAKLDYSAEYGFSTKSIKHNFKLLG